MKLDIKLTDRGTQLILKQVGEGLNNAFKAAFKEELDDMAKYARDFLEEASRRHTKKKYWTGTLQSAIKSNIIENNENKIEGIVGVDPTVTAEIKFGHRAVVDYDVIVEKIGRGSWSGYHYMEDMYTSLAPGMSDRIAKKLKGILPKIVKTPWAFRGAGGRWVSAPPGETWPTYK